MSEEAIRIGYVDTGSIFAELYSDRTFRVWSLGRYSKDLSRCYELLYITTPWGPSEGEPGRISLVACAEGIGGTIHFDDTPKHHVEDAIY